jgi:tryptophanyl-tRNA synthetase
MSKSYGNTIGMREEADSLDKKIRTMPTDPARVRLTDPGEPEKCPVWDFHKIYSDTDRQQWVQNGCRSASIGCIDCKKPLIDAMQAEIEPIRERAAMYEANVDIVKNIVIEGSEKARDEARKTMDSVRQAMKLDYV